MAARTENVYHLLALSGWHADPLSPAAAAERLDRARAALRSCYLVGGDDALGHRLQELIARHWLEQSVATELQSLGEVVRSEPARALVALVHGQLLMSRRLAGAHALLHSGFRLAAPFLRAGEYFQVLHRHELLAQLPLSPRPRPRPAQDLASLLAEAGVIRRLRGPRARAAGAGDVFDTLG